MFNKMRVTSMTNIDIRPYVHYLSDKLGHHLTDTAHGLYHPSQIDPLLIENEYYQLVVDNVLVKICYNGFIPTTPVYSLSGRTIVTSSMIKDGMLSPLPHHAVVERDLVVATALDRLDENLAHGYTMNVDTLSLIRDRNEKVNDEIFRVTSPLTTAIVNFIGDDINSVYDIECVGYMLYIVKYEDYRIYEWFKYKEKEQQELRDREDAASSGL
jgi:hypothetical protein